MRGNPKRGWLSLSRKRATVSASPGSEDGTRRLVARVATSPEGETGRGSVPPVLTFVHRADMPKAPEAVTLSDLQQQQALRASVAALDTDLRQERQSIEERLSMVERGLAEAVATAKRESDASLAALTELQKELAATRTLLRQTAQLATLNQEANTENASGIRKMATASQELAASSARLEETMRRLSETVPASEILSVHLRGLHSPLACRGRGQARPRARGSGGPGAAEDPRHRHE